MCFYASLNPLFVFDGVDENWHLESSQIFLFKQFSFINNSTAMNENSAFFVISF